MISVLTDKFGLISAGTSIPEKGKNKSSLALRPFTRGRYELYKKGDSYNINAAETIQSFYAIGEDVDKYLVASYVLELTWKMLPEDGQSSGMYKLLFDFLSLLSERRSDYDTLVIGYQVKALAAQGLSLSQNPLMKAQSNDKMSIVVFMEKHPLAALEKLSVSSESAESLKSIIKRYISDNLGVENLKSEGLHI